MNGGTIHASAFSLRGRGILVRGGPGTGKSSLVLSFVEDPRRDALLVADDRVELRSEGGAVIAVVPEPLRGLLEVRGVGIVRLPYRPQVVLGLVVDLVPAEAAPRLPEAEDRVAVLDATLPRVVMISGQHDAAQRIRIAASGVVI